MTVAVPGGGVAQIRYVGDVPPQIVVAPAPAAFPDAFGAWMPVASMPVASMPVASMPVASMPGASMFGPDSPFAMMDRIAAEMDRRAAAMFRYAEAMTDRANAGGLAETASTMPSGAVPFGGESYSFVSTLSGNGVCSQSVR